MFRLFARAIFVTLCLSAFSLRAQESPTTSMPSDYTPTTVSDATYGQQGPALTLDECVAQTLAKNFAVRIQSFTTALTQENIAIAKSGYEPTFGVSWNKTFRQDSLAVPDANTKPRTDTTSTDLNASLPLRTGGTLSADYNLQRTGTNNIQPFITNPPFDFNPTFNGLAALSLSQPLLQGFGLDYSRATIEIANLQAHVSRLDFKTAVLQAIQGVETAYYNLIFFRRQYAVGEDSLRLAQQLLDENTIKRRTGVLTDLDVVQAQAGVATARSQLILYKQQADNAQDILLQGMGERAFKSPVGPVDFPPLPSTEVSFDVSYKLARDNTPELTALRMDADLTKLQAMQAKRDSLPNLSAVVGGDYNSTDSSYSRANSTLWHGPGYGWNAGLTLSFPWGMNRNRALYRQAMDTVGRREAQYDQYDQNLVVQVRGAVRAVQSNVEAVAAAVQGAVLSQKQYDLQKAKFDAGLATSFDVVQAQNLLETARKTEIQAQVNLREALAALRYYEGTSLAMYRINLN